MQVDQIIFKRPVDIGDLVRLKSRVTFSGETLFSTADNNDNNDSNNSEPAVCVEVHCQVVRPEK